MGGLQSDDALRQRYDYVARQDRQQARDIFQKGREGAVEPDADRASVASARSTMSLEPHGKACWPK